MGDYHLEDINKRKKKKIGLWNKRKLVFYTYLQSDPPCQAWTSTCFLEPDQHLHTIQFFPNKRILRELRCSWLHKGLDFVEFLQPSHLWHQPIDLESCKWSGILFCSHSFHHPGHWWPWRCISIYTWASILSQLSDKRRSKINKYQNKKEKFTFKRIRKAQTAWSIHHLCDNFFDNAHRSSQLCHISSNWWQACVIFFVRFWFQLPIFWTF